MNKVRKVLNIVEIALNLMTVILLVLYLKDYRERALTEIEECAAT